MTGKVRSLLLTDAEYDALVAASVAFDGENMDRLDAQDEWGAQVRRERKALDRALDKAREWRA